MSESEDKEESLKKVRRRACRAGAGPAAYSITSVTSIKT